MTHYRPLAAIVLAAGEGSRIRSDTPKVLHELCGRPMVLHVVDASSPDGLRTGARVRARWADEPTGAITDIACFELVAAADAPAP